jgi:hypothetical protein
MARQGKKGRRDRALISNLSEASNFSAGEVLRGSTGFPSSRTLRNGTTGDLRGMAAFNRGRRKQGQSIVAGERVVLLYKSTRMIRYRYKGIKV